jgi:hypothetical protein
MAFLFASGDGMPVRRHAALTPKSTYEQGILVKEIVVSRSR